MNTTYRDDRMVDNMLSSSKENEHKFVDNDKTAKLELVMKVIKGEDSIPDISRSTGIPVRTIENWVRVIRENMPLIFRKNLMAKEKKKIMQLRAANRQMAKDILMLHDQVEKLSGVVHKLTTTGERKELIVQHSTNKSGSLAYWARVYDVPMSTIYYKPVNREPDELSIKRLMDRIHLENLSWGLTRIWEAVQASYPDIARHVIQRYMEDMQMTSVCPTSRPLPHRLRHAFIPYCIKKNKLTQANEVWAADLTYVPVGRSFLYLAVVIDWYTRFVVGWAISNKADHLLVIAALQDALQWGTPQILNNDQGSVYMGHDYANFIQSVTRDRNVVITRSVNGKGAWRDNIVMERWFRTLKYECLYQNKYDDVWSVFHLIKQYIREYNCFRPHNSLDRQTPSGLYMSFVS